jgi:hypothetical protein
MDYLPGKISDYSSAVSHQGPAIHGGLCALGQLSPAARSGLTHEPGCSSFVLHGQSGDLPPLRVRNDALAAFPGVASNDLLGVLIRQDREGR